jgi:aspartate kinase
MKIFKFGGASVKDAPSVRNVAAILRNYPGRPSVVVLSAMGKMTNAFERFAEYSFYEKNDLAEDQLLLIKNFHLDIVEELFPDPNHEAYARLEGLFNEIKNIAEKHERGCFDQFYDAIVPYGELLSTSIVSSFLEDAGLSHVLLDARNLISTNSTWRDARVSWPQTTLKIRTRIKQFSDLSENDASFILTQGFIGSDPNGHSTTLGREGSDFTAAIFAYVLNAKEVVIWKDVPGLLNADPKIFPETIKIDRLSYSDAIELAYYGGKIIHPKTIKPLQNKNIPLIIKSFNDSALPGSAICDSAEKYDLVPTYIFKFNQTLISITPKDFSFVNEEALFDIFRIFSEHRVRINLMQNSAISFSVCVDSGKTSFDSFLEALQHNYRVRYNQNLELITIRNYDQDCIKKVVKNRTILLEQRSRATVQLLVVPG